MDKDAHYSSCTGSSLPNAFPDDNSCPTDDTTLIYAPQLCQLNLPDGTLTVSSVEAKEIFGSRACDRDLHVPSLYTRLKTLFTVKGKADTLPTPPASPQSHKSRDLSVAATSPQEHASEICFVPFPTGLDTALPRRIQAVPLTPESIDLRSKNDYGPFPSFVNVITHFGLEKEQASAAHLRYEDPDTRNPQCLLDSFEETAQREFDDTNCLGATSTFQINSCKQLVDVASLKQDEYIDRGDGVHLIDEEHEPKSFRTKSVQWGKSAKPPIHWDVLIDDISESITSAARRDDTPHAYFALSSGVNCDEEYLYDLQYALELSRRDRRKLMDSDADSAGEYSKSRESWAILHLDRVMPSHQEYWFRYWLHWHHRLEERAAFKLAQARKKEEFRRYQLASAWPTVTHRTSRNPRRADEDLHPTLRLMRHRTRSAPGRISV